MSEGYRNEIGITQLENLVKVHVYEGNQTIMAGLMTGVSAHKVSMAFANVVNKEVIINDRIHQCKHKNKKQKSCEIGCRMNTFFAPRKISR